MTAQLPSIFELPLQWFSYFAIAINHKMGTRVTGEILPTSLLTVPDSESHDLGKSENGERNFIWQIMLKSWRESTVSEYQIVRFVME